MDDAAGCYDTIKRISVLKRVDMTSMIPDALSMSLDPSSLKRTLNVARQGKYRVSTTAAVAIWPAARSNPPSFRPPSPFGEVLQ